MPILGIVAAIIPMAVKLVDWYLRKTAHDEQAEKDRIAFIEIMDRKGLATVKMRMEAGNQMDRVTEAWKKEQQSEEK